MTLEKKRAAVTDVNREALPSRYARIRARTLALAEPLSPEDQAIQSMPDASPVKWHLAHTSWFFETFVLCRSTRYEIFNDAYGYLFNSYYEAEGPRHPRAARGMLSRPPLEEILAYRRHVDDAMGRLFETPGDESWTDESRLIELGLHHEEQHQELILMDVKHLLSLNPLQPSYGAFPPALVRDAPELSWIAFEGGLKEIGHDGRGFAFDNEGPRHKVWLEPFRLASRLTTNAEYQEFIDGGGYRRPEFWLADGWTAACAEGWQAPLYWRREGGGWRIFTLAGPQPINPAAPVCHLSYYEADAFARWKAKRLPREDEWEVAAAGACVAGNFAEKSVLHPLPAPGPGLAQMFGDAWEQTKSPYTPYPGFAPAPGAIGEYNGKFMANQFVLKGGSAATPGGHVSATYRNYFPPSARWAFSGVRLADDA